MKKKFFKAFLLSGLLLTFASCKSSNIPKEMYEKPFNTRGGGYVLIKKGNILEFQGPSKIKPDMDAEYLNDKDRFKKSELQTYKNVRIEEKEGKKYITADKFEYKLLLVDDYTIEDEEDKEVYINPEILRKNK
ncbi:MAG: hypothetical protein MRZ16_01335 [Parvimonas sp.]|uniref:hypothetical protein n=1 Tax=Parvimonas sp. TaxID=1944660 RepID=UPI0025FC6887|nr:hypothetical protein [Parvimonas sp.]MCI5996859.1 hypothetical protein [Parvimonas sp.]